MITIIACVVLPHYTVLSPPALRMVMLFIAAMFGIILDICHPIIWLLSIIVVASLSNTIDIKLGFSGFSNIVPWLLFAVLSLAKAITNSTLGLRLAYLFMKYFGGSIIGLSYSITFTELLIAPVLPSNTARAASLGLPLVTSLSKYISVNISGVSEKSIGAYLSILYSFTNAMTSGLFLTAMISNALIIESLSQINLFFDWISWFKYLVLPYFIVLLVLPFVLRVICNPNIKNLSKLKELATKNYELMGPISLQEKFILFVFIGMLIMWIGADYLHIPVMTTTLLGICVFVFTGILNIKDILSNYSTFNSVILLGLLMSLVNCLIHLGAINWFNNIMSESIGALDKEVSFILLTLVYYFAQYFFTGESSKIVALYVPFLTTGIALGIDKIILAITLASFSSASDVLASYTCPVALTMFSSGYLSLKRWIICGFIVAIIFLTVWYAYVWIFLR